jgi:hypothetical protein
VKALVFLFLCTIVAKWQTCMLEGCVRKRMGSGSDRTILNIKNQSESFGFFIFMYDRGEMADVYV